MRKHVALIVVAGATFVGGALLHAQQPAAPPGAGGAQDHVAALKQTMQQGMGLARKYEWVETTIISLKGEEKARKQHRCYYGADGKVQKVPLDQPPQQAPPQDEGRARAGRRGGGRVKQQVIENKKDEMKDYMQQAAALIHQYVPPNPQQIQAAKDAGRVAMDPQPGGKARLVISQYLKPGDSLTIDMDPAAHKVLALGVNSYIDKQDEPVTLAVQMASLPDGAIYAGQTTLEAKAKNITVVIQNSGHRPVQQ
jgi:hypothetical protein